MEKLQHVKRCSNPDCPSPARVYLNGKITCDACGSGLVVSRVKLNDSSIELLKSMEAMQSEVKTLVKKKCN